MRPFALLAVAFTLGGPRTDQVTTLDRGSFTLYVNNERVGREQFSIQQNQQGTTTEIVAYATITLQDRRLEPRLKTDTAGRPVSYDLTVKVADKVVTNVQAMVRGGRFSGLISSSGGHTKERDLPLAGGAVVLDDDVVHHYYFVARAPIGTAVVVVAPRRLERDTVRVALRAAGNVEVGNGSVPSRHLTVTASGGTVTDLWVDAAGRVLRVHVAARGLTAVRDEAPR